MKALILIADGFDDLQLFCPYYRLLEEGVAVTIASPRGHKAVGLRGFPIEADTPLAAVDPTEYDLLVIPGGQSPERLRLREEAIGWLGFAATLPDYRGRGAQSAILAARIEDARKQGCRMVTTETGELEEGRPGNSYRNIVGSVQKGSISSASTPSIVA